MSEVYLSRAGNLGPIVEYIEYAGGSAERVLSKASLPYGVFDHPDLLIPQREFFLVMEQAARELDDPVFGVNLGRQVKMEDMGQLGALLARAPTLETAIIFGSAKVCEMVQSGTELQLDVDDSEAVWGYRSLERATYGREQDGLLSVSYELAIVRSFLTQNWLPTAVIVPDRMRSAKSALELAFGTDVKFGGEFFSLMFDKSLLKIPRDESGTNSTELREGHVQRLIPDADDCAAITRLLCDFELETGLPKIERVAALQGLLPRTLQRRLRQQGVTFRQMAVDAVMERADKLVVQSDWPIHRIAPHLGYAETSQFSRAYKSRTGVSPKEMRNLVRS